MMLNRQGRSTVAGEAEERESETFSGNRGLAVEEALIFEIGRTDTTGVDLDEPAKFSARLGKLVRTEPLGLPGLSEPETMRISCGSAENYGIDTGCFRAGPHQKHTAPQRRMAPLPVRDVLPAAFSTVPGPGVSQTIAWISELTACRDCMSPGRSPR